MQNSENGFPNSILAHSSKMNTEKQQFPPIVIIAAAHITVYTKAILTVLGVESNGIHWNSIKYEPT